MISKTVSMPVSPTEVFEEIERWGNEVMKIVLLKTFKLEIREPEGLIEVEMSGVMLKGKTDEGGKTCPKCEDEMRDLRDGR